MRWRVPTLLLALAITGTAIAADDPPARVGRLSLIQGQVVYQAPDGAPEAAGLNRSLTWGDRLMTDRGSRAEMSIGTAAIRLDDSTDLTIANLDADIAQLELNSGTLGIHLRELGEGETFEVDTPNATVLLLRPGDYRIEADTQGTSMLVVRNGEAELDGGAGPIRLTDQQELRFTGAEQSADVAALGPLTEFDEWCIERERTLTASQTTRYVSRDVVGYEDLDQYGTWYHEPAYGYVWSPSYISIGWAPYTFGYWSWFGPWGFTWVDYAPWGYAPFHYGRWAYAHDRWCWVPPPRRHPHSVWSPALVGWNRMHGAGHGGTVGWYPLGPREVYVPVHAASPRYVRAVNIANTRIDNNARITNEFRGRVPNVRHVNVGAPGALTTVPAAAFGAHRPSVDRSLRVDPDQPERSGPRVSSRQPAPVRDSRWQDSFNARRQNPEPVPRSTLGPRENEGSVVGERRTNPRLPDERRTVRLYRSAPDSPAARAPAIRQAEQTSGRARHEPPRMIARSDEPRNAVRTEPPRNAVRGEPARGVPPQYLQQPQVQYAPSQQSRGWQPDSGRSSQSDSGRSYGGGWASSGRQSYDSGSSASSGRQSYGSGGSVHSGRQSYGSGGSTRSGMSSSRGQSGASGWSTNRQ
jgi:hypothetical protein